MFESIGNALAELGAFLCAVWASIKRFLAFFSALWSFIRHGDAPIQLHDKRMGICAQCSAMNVTETGVYCVECKCPKWALSDLRTKWRMRNLRCPLKKW